jgi:hypothetical protein
MNTYHVFNFYKRKNNGRLFLTSPWDSCSSQKKNVTSWGPFCVNITSPIKVTKTKKLQGFLDTHTNQIVQHKTLNPL